MEQHISNYIKKELCKKNKYDKTVLANIHQRAIEEYEKLKNQNEDDVWTYLKETIDLEISRIQPNSKYLFILLTSLVLLGISCIECILLSVDFFYILPEFIIVDVVLFGVLIYACFFKKNKSLWNLFLILFIIIWLASFFYIRSSKLNMLGETMDEKTIVSFIFPCVYLKERYAYGGFLTGGIVYYCFGLYFNWIVSFILSIVFSVLYHRERRNINSNEVTVKKDINRIRKK